MRGGTSSDQGGGIRMRMQMGDASPFCSADILRRKSCDSSLCGSVEAHESLRRFAEGYSFGTTANLGTSTPQLKVERPVEEGNISGGSSQLQPSSLVTSTSLETQTTNVNPVLQTFGNSQSVTVNEDFKSRAALCSPYELADWEKVKEECQSGPSAWEPHNNLRERDWELERNTFTDRCEKGRRRRERGTLVFGENAVRTPLPVRERIERRVIPKRMRDNVAVDALAVMIEGMLATDRHGKKLRCAIGDNRSPNNSHKFKEKIRDAVCDGNYERENESAKVNAMTTNVYESGKCVNSPSDGVVHQPESANVYGGDTSARRVDNVHAGDIDDDGTTDELSFLVQRCDLEPERKQAHFMPYIT